jgi:hypothetical protein
VAAFLGLASDDGGAGSGVVSLLFADGMEFNGHAR